MGIGKPGTMAMAEILTKIGKEEDVDVNKTISDGGITVDFSIIKVHTSN